MQVAVETTSGLERRITVGIPASDIDSEVQKRLHEATKTVRINGFRKGKVPLRIVKQRYGAGVRQEVLGDAINRSFQDAVQKENLRPAGTPNIEPKNMEEGADVEFVATFEVYPEIEIADMSQAEYVHYMADIEESDIDNMIETLRKSQSEWKTSKGKAAKDDRLKISYVGKKDGEAFDGGSAEDQFLVLGSQAMIPGFEDGLIGAKAGDERELDLTFPEDYQSPELAGANVAFSVKVTGVEKQKLPAVDDTFMEKFGITEGGIEKFRIDVKENMEREKKKALRNKLKQQVMDTLLSYHDIDVPKALVSDEIETLRSQAAQQYGAVAEKIDIKAVLPDDMFRDQAEKRSSLGLIVSEIVRKENMQADADKVKELVEESASTYENPEEVVNYYYANPQLLQSMEAAALEDQVIEFLIEKGAVKEEKVSYDEALKPLEKAADA